MEEQPPASPAEIKALLRDPATAFEGHETVCGLKGCSGKNMFFKSKSGKRFVLAGAVFDCGYFLPIQRAKEVLLDEAQDNAREQTSGEALPEAHASSEDGT